ncbi:MAG: hypothetical protein ABIJ08_06890, partial [Nanoarchaeota archaeon]
YIVEDIVDNEVRATLFIDEDFKEKIVPLNIIWGATYTNIKSFEYNVVKKGVYMDTIVDERSRFNEDYSMSKGGVILGNLDLENVNNEDISDVIFVRIV